MKLLYFFLSLIYSTSIYCQINLIPNPGFEMGITVPKCNYGTSDYIDDDISYWKRASCSNFGPFVCKYKYSWPDWMDSQNCGILPVNQTKYIYLEEDTRNGNQDAIRVGLLSTMNISKNYIFKINYTGTRRKNTTLQPSETIPRLTFT